MKRIAIVGGALSGTLLALELIRNKATAEIYLIEKKAFARGIAYADIDDELVLNVRCDNMGAFSDKLSII